MKQSNSSFFINQDPPLFKSSSDFKGLRFIMRKNCTHSYNTMHPNVTRVAFEVSSYWVRVKKFPTSWVLRSSVSAFKHSANVFLLGQLAYLLVRHILFRIWYCNMKVGYLVGLERIFIFERLSGCMQKVRLNRDDATWYVFDWEVCFDGFCFHIQIFGYSYLSPYTLDRAKIS